MTPRPLTPNQRTLLARLASGEGTLEQYHSGGYAFRPRAEPDRTQRWNHATASGLVVRGLVAGNGGWPTIRYRVTPKGWQVAAEGDALAHRRRSALLSSRGICPDCGTSGETRGHPGCQYPGRTEDALDTALTDPMATER